LVELRPLHSFPTRRSSDLGGGPLTSFSPACFNAPMFQPVQVFVGLRYVRSRRRRGIVSFMSGASLIGVALGVAALIVILSVMNGLESELRTRLLSLTAHATITAPTGVDDWRALAARVADGDGVQSVSPYVTLEAMLASGTNLRPVIVRGILPAEEHVMAESLLMVDEGRIDALDAGGNEVILGRTLAALLGEIGRAHV